MKSTRIAINGLGRVGKLLLRDFADKGMLDQVVLLNDEAGTLEEHAHLLEFDSVHGRWGADIQVTENGLCINGVNIALSKQSDISSLPLAELGVELLIDCTGQYRDKASIEPYFSAGVSKVLVSCPVKDGSANNIVFGVNHETYNPDKDNIVTAASCTTNCIAPVIKVLHENIGITHGSITTLHNVTNTQTIVDKPGKDLRRARSALNSLIPTTTGSATAISLIYPELKGRLDGHAVRVPLLNASLTDCVFEMSRPVTANELNELFKAASEGMLKGILGYETRPLVSSDYVNDPHSAIIDAQSTLVVNKTQAKIYAWYDNEWAYACRMGDIARHMIA